MYCRNCGEQLNDNQAICLRCGVKVGNGSKYCANCGTEVSEDAAVCLNCGVAIKKAGTTDALEGTIGGQNKLLMILICLFLGTIGIHNFIFGEIKKGIIKIVFCFCFGLSIILMIIDLIKLCTDKYEINPDKFF